MDMKFNSLFGITDLEDISLESDDSVFVEGTLKNEQSCPRCGNGHLHRQTKKHRILLLPPIGGKKVKLQVFIQKRKCVKCNHAWWPKIPFAQGKQRMTKSFVNHAIDLLRFGTIKDVAMHLGVNWNRIKGIHKEHLTEIYRDIDMSDVKHVSIDEFSIAKGHKYMTTIMDIKTGRILFAIEGRKINDITPALTELKKKHLSLKLLQWT
jgi:transposase